MADLISVNKFISDTGYCSRREADKYIDQGRVHINGKVAKKGNRVSFDDDVTVDFEAVVKKKKKKKKNIYLVVNKADGIVCTTDHKEKDNIVDYVNYPKRIFPIGRLDKNSTGLILMTNDGDIVNKILREENNHEKEYVVSTNKPITGEFIEGMSNGVRIMGTRTKKCKVRRLGKNSFSITLTQGLNRQIRRMCNAFDYKVVTLHRVRIMNITLGKLKLGQYRHLAEDELATLLSLL
ncbi:pseudouridine synthase [Saprospiraceae bacterium]|nr:pseudouridine synthase [Saprospiraceae bacterium]